MKKWRNRLHDMPPQDGTEFWAWVWKDEIRLVSWHPMTEWRPGAWFPTHDHSEEAHFTYWVPKSEINNPQPETA